MKKTSYLIPEMEVVEIEVRKMLCASDGSTEGGSGALDDTPSDPGTNPFM